MVIDNPSHEIRDLFKLDVRYAKYNKQSNSQIKRTPGIKILKIDNIEFFDEPKQIKIKLNDLIEQNLISSIRSPSNKILEISTNDETKLKATKNNKTRSMKRKKLNLSRRKKKSRNSKSKVRLPILNKNHEQNYKVNSFTSEEILLESGMIKYEALPFIRNRNELSNDELGQNRNSYTKYFEKEENEVDMNLPDGLVFLGDIEKANPRWQKKMIDLIQNFK